MAVFVGVKRIGRRAWWLARVAGAALVGATVRRIRRVNGRPPRIWHGMYPLHGTKYLVRADRAAGYPSRSVAMNTRQIDYALVAEADFDVTIEQPGIPWDSVRWLSLIDLLRNGDIWVAYFECLFFHTDREWANRWTLRLIRWVGIRTIVAPHGGDVLHLSRYVSRFDWIGRLQRDYETWDLVAQRAIVESRLRLFCGHADLVVANDSTLARFLPRRDLLFKYTPIDCGEIRPHAATHNQTPVIVHAPNHRFVKGTDVLIAAVDRLRAKGIEGRLVLVERVPREEALGLYRNADIIADQFCCGAFGIFALEGMALGKPVLAYLDQEHLGDPAFNHPVVNSNPENLERVLAVLLEIPALRERIGQASRESVEKYQSVEALSHVWDRIYRHVWWGEEMGLERTAHFDSRRGTRAFTEDPAAPEFWPVPVADLHDQILDILGRISGGARDCAAASGVEG